MTTFDLPKAYDFQATEQRIYDWWEKNGYFAPTNDPNRPGHDPTIQPFVISIPPANVTGELHLGHAMFVSMEDLMIRYHRMKGIPTLWVPGTDHAGIATQLQVEKDLLRTEEVTREEIGREAFLERSWQWKGKYHTLISRQVRRLGASCDWSRERFTLDDGLSHAVREAFVRLYEKGLIYRGPRLVNWSPGLKTAVSDLEVEYSEEDAHLYYFKYMLAGSDEFIPVATVRPETILADTAVAVHPEDPRYQKFIGRQALVPILNREIPVIADDYVSREFGTGALKITPGHDPNDYVIGQRHNLPILSMLDREAKVTDVGGPYAGLDRFECRKRLWHDMKKAGLVIKTEPYRTTLPRSQRGGEIIEPMISTQWFVKIEPLAQVAIESVRSGRIRIVPEFFEKVYYNWLENIQDWCISRQLWWGHRIPVWYCADCGAQTCTRQDPTHCAACGSERIAQDPDVLDTWFSSALWPFSSLGWPETTPDLSYFYPTSYMETGYDILFFWVARMIMTGMEFTGQEPFHTVYLHGLIRDEHGRKMSKTYGNVVDPLNVMNAFGTDALRYTLLVGSTPGMDMNLSLKKVEANRNFINKLWNAGRLVISLLSKAPAAPQADPQWTMADAYIFGRLKALTRDVERLFQGFQYGEAGRQIYEFFWNEYADWYLEIAKLQIADGGNRAFYTANLAVRTYEYMLRMLQPFTPFVTEELWGHLKRACQETSPHHQPQDGAWAEALILARWPEPMLDEGWEAESITGFNQVQEIVRAVRNLRAEYDVKPGRKLASIFVVSHEAHHMLYHQLEEDPRLITALAGLDESHLKLVESLPSKPEGHTALVAGGVEIFLPLASLVDSEAERARLAKELAEVESQITRLEKLLAGSFAEKAPAALVKKEREKLVSYQQTAEKLHSQIKRVLKKGNG